MQRGRYVVLEAVLKGAARGTPQHGRVVGASAARIARNNSAVFGSAAQRRSMSDESKKQAPPKAGPGFFATFMKSFREQMGEKEKSDEDLAKAREKLEESRLEALARANATVSVALRQCCGKSSTLDFSAPLCCPSPGHRLRVARKNS
eukprot:3924300-Rhodomonas_salina.5